MAGSKDYGQFSIYVYTHVYIYIYIIVVICIHRTTCMYTCTKCNLEKWAQTLGDFNFKGHFEVNIRTASFQSAVWKSEPRPWEISTSKVYIYTYIYIYIYIVCVCVCVCVFLPMHFEVNISNGSEIRDPQFENMK